MSQIHLNQMVCLLLNLWYLSGKRKGGQSSFFVRAQEMTRTEINASEAQRVNVESISNVTVIFPHSPAKKEEGERYHRGVDQGRSPEGHQ